MRCTFIAELLPAILRVGYLLEMGAGKMRVAIVSDVHGNRRALEAVLIDLRDVAPDLVLHGGDLAYGGAHAAEIVDQVRALGWGGVRGNTDEMLWAPKSLAGFAASAPKIAPLLARIQEMIPPTLASIGEERLRWLEGLPCEYSGEGFSLVHASPGDLWRAPMPDASDEELRGTYASLGKRIVVYGHIHRPYVRRLQGMTVANSGSVSQSYDGDRRASYLVIDGASILIRRVAYDVDAEAEDVLHSGLPHAKWLARILCAGQYVPPE
jgi:putative phosphoesterase